MRLGGMRLRGMRLGGMRLGGMRLAAMIAALATRNPDKIGVDPVSSSLSSAPKYIR